MKIQNNTNEDYEKIALHINGYDKNGDKVGSCSIDVNDIEAGHAVWANHIHPDVLAEEFGSIKISYYEVMEWVGQNTVSAKEKVNLDPKPEVTFDQMSKY